jgi:hypothetical protein
MTRPICLIPWTYAIGTALVSLAFPAHAQQTGCEAIQDRQARTACFTRAGIPVVDCANPYDAEEAAFCRTIPARRTTAPAAQAPTATPSRAPAPANAAPPPEIARAATIADDSGQWAGTINVDTLQLNYSTNIGSATVCHQSEHGPSCNVWTFKCDQTSLLDGAVAQTDYSAMFLQRVNMQSLTAGQNSELMALGAVASKLPAAACRLRGVTLPVDNPQWVDVRESSGDVKATIDLSSVKMDSEGNAHARVCLNFESGMTCPNSKMVLRWYFNCSTHEYSAIDTSVLPGFPHEMSKPQPNSVADKLAALACKSE